MVGVANSGGKGDPTLLLGWEEKGKRWEEIKGEKCE